jgi:hypothetical protein
VHPFHTGIHVDIGRDSIIGGDAKPDARGRAAVAPMGDIRRDFVKGEFMLDEALAKSGL